MCTKSIFPQLLCVVLLLAFALPLSAVEVADPGQGPVLLPAGMTGATELSGITWASGNTWWAVSDNVSAAARAYPVTVSFNPDGTIAGTPSVGDALVLAAGDDPEGIAYAPGVLAVSDEVGPAIRFFSPVDGSVLQNLAIPAVFLGTRSNLGFESLAFGPDGALWTANEEALTSDGDVSSLTAGTIVRIQRFDSELAPMGQWGYVTDPIPGDVILSAPGRDVEVSGVADIALLPDSSILVLERAFGGIDGAGSPGFRIRIYQAHLDGADFTTDMPSLSIGSFVPVGKTLVFESITEAPTPDNFEGLGVGPFLPDGGSALLLIGDDGDGVTGFEPQQSLRSLVENLIRFSDSFESGTTDRWSGEVP